MAAKKLLHDAGRLLIRCCYLLVFSTTATLNGEYLLNET